MCPDCILFGYFDVQMYKGRNGVRGENICINHDLMSGKEERKIKKKTWLERSERKNIKIGYNKENGDGTDTLES